MKFLAIVAVMVAAASYPTLGAEISQVECQNTLQKATEMIKRCSLPSFIDCCQLNTLIPSTRTGLYEISNVCPRKRQSPFLQVQTLSEKINVRCDMDTDGGGWIVIQRRVNGGKVNFTQNWEAYELGFGDLEGEFWFGLRNIHCLTAREEVELRIDLQNSTGTNVTWTYQEFRVDGPDDNYRLHIGQGEGALGTIYTVDNNNRAFSTYDRDNESNCGKSQRGGWWHGRCGRTFLNSPHGSLLKVYYRTRVSDGWLYPSNVEMKVRPKTCTRTLPPVAKQCT